jgi:hypothetical protein
MPVYMTRHFNFLFSYSLLIKASLQDFFKWTDT